MRACQHDEHALIERSVGPRSEAERLRQHECRLRDIHSAAELAWPRLRRGLPVAHPLDAMVLSHDGPENLVRPESRGNALKDQKKLEEAAAYSTNWR